MCVLLRIGMGTAERRTGTFVFFLHMAQNFISFSSAYLHKKPNRSMNLAVSPRWCPHHHTTTSPLPPSTYPEIKQRPSFFKHISATAKFHIVFPIAMVEGSWKLISLLVL